MSQVVLCIDSESVRQPAMLGLSGENLVAQTWLKLFTSAEPARKYLRLDADAKEVWVASSDDVEPINLAAAIKHDRHDRRVYLLAFQGTGSLWSRASAAGIDATLSHQAFVRRYTDEKRRWSGGMSVVTTPSDRSTFATQVPVVEPSVTPIPFGVSTSSATPALSAASVAPVSRGAVLSSAASVNDVKSVAPAEQRFALAQSVLEKDIPAGRQAFLLPVASGSGGAGKSTVAVLAAVIARKLGYKTLLLDYDFQFGDMREMLGMPEALSIDELLAAPTRLAHMVTEKGKPTLLAAPRRLETSETVVAETPALLDVLMPRFDVIIANTGAFWGEQHALLLERGSKSLFLIDQRASSLRACKHAFELCTRCGIAANPFVFVANRCTKGALFTSIDVSCALQGAHTVELRDGGRDVEDLLSAGMPLGLVADHNDLCVSLEQLLVDLLPGSPAAKEAQAVEPTKTSRGFFQKRKTRRRRGTA